MAKSLEELKAAKTERAKQYQAEAEAREVEELTVEEALCEKLGRRGIDFDIVNSDVGVFAVRRPEFTIVKGFNALPVEKRDDETVVKFVASCIEHPTQMAFREVATKHSGLAWRLAKAMLAMSSGNALEESGKF